MLLTTLDSTTTSIDVSCGEDDLMIEFEKFVKLIEQNFVAQTLASQNEWFQNEGCALESFNSHVKDEERCIRFNCRQARLYDEVGNPCTTIGGHSTVAAIVEISHGWFWQHQWGLKMKCTQVKKLRGSSRPVQSMFVQEPELDASQQLNIQSRAVDRDVEKCKRTKVTCLFVPE